MFRVVTLFAFIVVASASEGKTLRLYIIFGSVMLSFSSVSVFEQANFQAEEVNNLCFGAIFAMPQFGPSAAFCLLTKCLGHLDTNETKHLIHRLLNAFVTLASTRNL